MYLITGSSGFIGQNLINDSLFVEKKTFLLTTTNYENKKFEVIKYQNLQRFEKKVLNKVEYLIHLGDYIPKNSFDLKKRNKKEYDSASLISKNLINKLKNLKKVIYLSSIDVYGLQKQTLDESSTTFPQTYYAIHKLKSEKLLIDQCSKKNISLLIIRLGHTYGPGEIKFEKLIPNLIKSSLKNTSFLFNGNFQDERAYLYVEDLVEIIVQSLNSKTNGIVNITGISQVKVEQLINIIENISGRKIDIISNQSKDIKKLIFSNELQNKYFKLSYTTYEEGLKKQYESFKKSI
jgi:UDP-glucose 4-epimerase